MPLYTAVEITPGLVVRPTGQRSSDTRRMVVDVHVENDGVARLTEGDVRDLIEVLREAVG